MRTTVVLSLGLLFGATITANAQDKAKYHYPVIQGYGGVTPLPQAAQQPLRGTKLLVDITLGDTKDGVFTGLHKAARFMNLFGQARLKHGKDFDMVIVVHGSATKMVLSDKAYAKHEKGQPNPHLPLVREFAKHGVQFFVCGQALNDRDFSTTEVASEVTVAYSALTTLVNLQKEGYTLILLK